MPSRPQNEEGAEFTPGPWYQDEAGIVAGERLVCTIARGDDFWETPDDELPAEEVATLCANARLISSAPDLYEALKEIKEVLRFALLCTTPDIAKDGMEFIRRAEAALSKAESGK